MQRADENGELLFFHVLQLVDKHDYGNLCALSRRTHGFQKRGQILF